MSAERSHHIWAVTHSFFDIQGRFDLATIAAFPIFFELSSPIYKWEIASALVSPNKIHIGGGFKLLTNASKRCCDLDTMHEVKNLSHNERRKRGKHSDFNTYIDISAATIAN